MTMTTGVSSDVLITAEHRCDKCGAAAKVRATLLNGELYFCGHHARKAGDSLLVTAVKVFDPESVLDDSSRE
jgi:hypothetical protein